jgi:hypothetical protein
MTTAQRNNISTPAKGLLVYDTDLNALYHYNGNAWAAVGGSGSLSLPYTASTNQAGDAFSIANTGAGTAISGNTSANSIAAIEGSSTATTGGYGILGNSTSATGFGVGGTNATGTAVYGFSSGTGTALRGVSSNGYGLLVSGNLRLTGGNTSPSAGAVLTSVDANGNAVWKPRKVGFAASHPPTGANIADATTTTMFLDNEEFDSGNDFNPQSSAADPSTFIAPASGVYQFYAEVQIYLSSNVFNLSIGRMILQKNGIEIANYISIHPDNTSTSSTMWLSLNRTIKLNAGDKIKVVLRQVNSGNLTAQQYEAYFTGHLIYAD